MPENPRIEELRRRVQADPASIAFAALAEEFRRVGRYDDAIETCRTGLQRHPAYLSARVTLGRALIEIAEYDAAREELETVLRSAPENLAAIRGLAMIHERLGQSAEMHPDLHAIADEPIRLAPPPLPPPAPPVPSVQPPAASSTLSLDRVQPPAPPVPEASPAADDDLLVPMDIFASAAPPATPPPPPAIAFESAAIAFEAPVFTPPASGSSTPRPEIGVASSSAPAVWAEHVPVEEHALDDALEVAPVLRAAGDEPSAPGPDPHVAATLLRLERFLGAIQSSRHA